MIPAISQICSLHSSFEQDVEDYAGGNCPAIEIWLTKLENYLCDHSTDDARRLFQEYEIQPAAASIQGGLLDSQGEARLEAWKLFQSRLDLCQSLDIPCLVIAADVDGPLSQETLDRTSRSLTEAATAAGQRGLRIALEFRCRSSFLNNLQTATAAIEEVASPHLGICLDIFHFGIGPSKLSDLQYVTKKNLFHVQLCDVADTARELATDSDRILPGDGDLPIAAVTNHLHTIQYDKFVSLEVMNPQLWKVPATQMSEIGMTALRRSLEQVI